MAGSWLPIKLTSTDYILNQSEAGPSSEHYLSQI